VLVVFMVVMMLYVDANGGTRKSMHEMRRGASGVMRLIGSTDLSGIQVRYATEFINTMANSNQKLLRWSLELQQYTLDIKHRPGKENWMPDLLSRPSPVGSSSVLLGS